MLYIDGGSCFALVSAPSIKLTSTAGEIYTSKGGGFTFGSTLAIELASSWNSTNVTATATDKPVPFPFARQSWFRSAGDNRLNSLGGWPYESLQGWFSGVGNYSGMFVTNQTLWE